MAVTVTKVSDVSLFSMALHVVLLVICKVILLTKCFQTHHSSQKHCRSHHHVCTGAPADTLKHTHKHISDKRRLNKPFKQCKRAAHSHKEAVLSLSSLTVSLIISLLTS